MGQGWVLLSVGPILGQDLGVIEERPWRVRWAGLEDFLLLIFT